LIKKGGREVVRRGEAGNQLDPVAAVVSGSAGGAGRQAGPNESP
jgi:hypothetical protein